MKHWGHENKGNDHQVKNPLIVEQILLQVPLEIYREKNREDAKLSQGVKG